MKKDEFKDFLNNLDKQTEKKTQMDWNKEKEEWLDYLNKLYQMVENYLSEYLDTDKVRIARSKIFLEEENIGTYNVDMLDIFLGEKKISMKPIGTLLIATKGRVDMEGDSNTIRFLLVDSKKRSLRDHIHTKIYTDDTKLEKNTLKSFNEPVDWVWRIVDEKESYRYKELTEEAFLDALLKVSK